MPMDDLCKTCDISKIAPTLVNPTGTSFTSTELAADGECKMTKVECKRTDGKKCTEVGLNAKSGAQTSLLMRTEDSDTVTATLTCAEDGTYTSGTTTGITKLECVFEECAAAEPCKTCNTAPLESMVPDGTALVFSETVGTCKETKVKCKRTDDQICDKISIIIRADAPSGEDLIQEIMNTNEAEITIFCKEDGFYGYGPLELAADGECKMTKVECKRTDGQKCTEVGLNAKSGVQTSLLMRTDDSDTVTATLTCAEDGTYSSGTVTGITQLECVFEECAATPPCQTCTLTKPMGDDNTDIVISQAVENGCNVATVTCKRTDDQICDRITHQGKIGNGISDLTFLDDTNESEQKFFCQADGLYAGGSSTQISQVFCKFDGCKPAAPACPCNLESLAPTSNPPELVYEAEWTGPPGECMSTKIGCRKTNGQLCQLIELRDVSGVQIVSAIDATSRETTSIKCQPDGTFNYLGLITVTGLFCQQTTCS